MRAKQRNHHLSSPLSQSAANPELPGFEIVRELGRGGMGVVYLAREVSLGRLVAVKMLLSGEFASAALRRRFRTEAESAARLRHPNIVTVHATGEQSGLPYLVMEYVEGDSLDRVLAGTPLDPPAAARLLLPLAEAVEHAHRAGVVHRDLKPANILLQVGSGQPAVGSEDSASSLPAAHCSLPTAMIADFGLARTSGGSGATVTGQILGTPSYMAPEQAACAREIGPAADIYSLGAILYECITGRPPFKAATPLETITQVTSREPAAPRRRRPPRPP